MFPILQRQAVKFAGDEGFQRGVFLHVARIFQQLRGEIGQLLFLRGGEFGQRQFVKLVNVDMRRDFVADVVKLAASICVS